MKKTLKTLIASLLVLAIFAGMTAISFAADSEASTARLLNIYGTSMLFKQKEEVSIRGYAKGGSEITCFMTDENGEPVLKAKAQTNRSGEFEINFMAPEGAFKTYGIAFYENGVGFAYLGDVVFGELWLASGQSNMQYPLLSSYGVEEDYNAGVKLNKWLRAFLVPSVTPYHGNTEAVPADPQKEIEGAMWVTGENISMYGVSAVAYYFAAKLMEEIDMPVGIINASLGGSSIASWLSREAIDGDAQVKADFVNAGEYYDYNTWNEKERSMYYDMTSNFNNKINAVRPFRLSGMIWYQGETDAVFQWEYGRYSRAFDLMQRSYTEYFEHKNGLLPIVYTSLCSCAYSDEVNMLDMNMEFQDIQQAQPESRALISVYDVPLDYYESVGSIHPAYKQPIGERMTYAALGMVYYKYDTYTTATVKSSEIKDGCVYVSFRNVGSGLNFKGSKLNGFSVCGEDGVYVQAEAKIVSDDTVCIKSESVAEPVSASYAYFLSNQACNLCATQGKSTFIPVAPFITDKAVGTRYAKYNAWTDCEDEISWRCVSPSDKAGYMATWKADNADISFSEASAFSGAKGLSVISDSKSFSVNPNFSCSDKKRSDTCTDVETDLSDYGTMTVKVRNNGSSDLKLQSVRIYVNGASYYSPVVNDTKDVTAVIPADGEWHTVTYDLNRIYLTGNEGGVAYSNEKLDDIKSIEFNFRSTEKNNDISIDELRFTADTAETNSTEFNPIFSNIDNPFEFISALFISFIGLFVKLFR